MREKCKSDQRQMISGLQAEQQSPEATYHGAALVAETLAVASVSSSH